jgi:hypothetical protein
MHRRFRLWHLLLFSLPVIPLTLVLVVYLLGRANTEKEDEIRHGKLFSSFATEMKEVAGKLSSVKVGDRYIACTMTDERPGSKTLEEFKQRVESKAIKGVIFEFETNDPNEIDQLTLKVEKALSVFAAEHDAQPRPTRESWPQGHIQSFEFAYDFPADPEARGGTISGDVEVDGSSSKVIVHIAEG